MKRWLMPLIASLCLAGCGGGDFSDLRAYMDQQLAMPKQPIEPIPRFPAYEPFNYEATGLRNPFQPPVKIDLVNRGKGSRLVKPDPNRIKQFLEGFNIDQFEMVGTLSNDTGTFGLVRGGGGVHRVKVGDYMGKNDGRITSIGDTQIDLVEIISDGEGAYLERPRVITLKEHP